MDPNLILKKVRDSSGANVEGNELTLTEGEIIENDVVLDDDWWQGTNRKNQSGMFPASYVEKR